MAIVTFNPTDALPAYDMVQARLDFPALMSSYGSANLTTTRISLSSSVRNRTVIEGTGFKYTTDNGNLIFTDGVMQSLTTRIGSLSPTITFTGLGVDLAEFGALLNRSSANAYDLLLAGNDEVTGAGGNDVLKGFKGNDILNGLGGNDTLNGDVGNDTLSGGDRGDLLNGGSGNDILNGDAGDDSLVGSFGNDTFSGAAGNDVMSGDAGNDNMSGGAGNDTITGAAGNDTQNGDLGNDVMSGGAGNDNMNGGAGIDTLNGDAGADTLNGGDSNDNLNGGDGRDTLIGGAGADKIDGDLGIDNLTGGTGGDKFIFNDALGTLNIDVITDFNVPADTIQLDDLVFVGTSLGVLAAAAFESNTTGKAQDSSDRIIYEEDTGRLFYDRDGSGAAFGRVQFATVDIDLSLTNADFFVF